MAKHGLGKGLSALFSLYDEPSASNSTQKKQSATGGSIGKREYNPVDVPSENEFEETMEKARQEERRVAPAPQPKKAPVMQEPEDVDAILEKAKSLLDDMKIPGAIRIESDDIPPVQNMNYTTERENLERKLNKVGEEISYRELPHGVVELPISQVDINIDQPRKNFNKEAMAELSESIKQHGVIQPIVVVERNGRYMIVAGERRYRASKMAGMKVIPAIIKNYTNREVKQIALIENLQREDLNPVEVAYAIKQLIEDFGFTQDQVAERLGVSRPLVTNTLRILRLEPEVVAMVEKGTLSTAFAKVLGGVNNREDQIKFARKACNDKMTVREFERMVQEYLNPEKFKKKHAQLTSDLQNFVSRLQSTFKTKVGMFGTDKKGRIYIDYYTRDDLDRISDIMQKLGY